MLKKCNTTPCTSSAQASLEWACDSCGYTERKYFARPNHQLGINLFTHVCVYNWIECALDFRGKLEEKVAWNCLKAANGIDEDFVSTCILICFRSCNTYHMLWWWRAGRWLAFGDFLATLTTTNLLFVMEMRAQKLFWNSHLTYFFALRQLRPCGY